MTALPLILAMLVADASPRRAEGPAAVALARELTQGLLAQPLEGPIGLFVQSEAPELARAVQTLIAGELSSRAFPAIAIDAPSAESSEAVARAAGARCLVRLTIALEHGLLAARGDLLGTRPNFWSGADRTRPAHPAAALIASVEADAHALALSAAQAVPAPPPSPLVGPLKLVGAHFARLPAAPAALAAGDLDGDGTQEIAVLTDEEVLLYSAEGKLLARHEHRSLPNAEAPCREPFGAIAIAPSPRRLWYFSARRARGEVLSFDPTSGLRPQATIDEAPLGFSGELGLFGRLGGGTNTFAPEVTLAGKSLGLGARFASAAIREGAFVFVFPDGAAAFGRNSPTERLRAQGAGAGVALADFGGDGQLQLVTSSPRHQVEPDELRISSLASLEALAAQGTPVELATHGPLWQGHSLRGRVLAIAAADLDGDKVDELLLGVWLADGGGELQLFRRASP